MNEVVLTQYGRKDLLENGYTGTYKLGSGSFGVVFAAKPKNKDEYVAIKYFSFSGDETIREIHIQHALAKRVEGLMHATQMGVFEGEGDHVIVWMEMPLAEGNSFNEYLEKMVQRMRTAELKEHTSRLQAESTKVMFLLHNILCGLTGLHKVGLLHGDLKPRNILLLKRDGPAVLADFGLAASAQALRRREGLETFSWPWRPIEAFLYPLEHLQKSGDIWALGMIIYQILCSLVLNYSSSFFQPQTFGETTKVKDFALGLAKWQGFTGDLKQLEKQESPLPDVKHMLKQTAKANKKQLTVDTFVWSEETAFLVDLVQQCIRLRPQDRSTSFALLHQVTDFIRKSGQNVPSCTLSRTEKAFKVRARAEEKKQIKEELQFETALLDYATLAKGHTEKDKVQLKWIIQQARDLIQQWEVPSDSADAMLIRCLVTMLYWGSGDSDLWEPDRQDDSTKIVNPELVTFLKDIHLYDREEGPIHSFDALMRALQPWFLQLEAWYEENNSNAYSIANK